MAPLMLVPLVLSLYSTTPVVAGHDGHASTLRRVSLSPMYGKSVRVCYRTRKVDNTMRGKLTYRPLFPPSLPLAIPSYPICFVPLALCWPPLPFVGPVYPLWPRVVPTFSGLLLSLLFERARCMAICGALAPSVVPRVALAPPLCSGLVPPPAISVCARRVQSNARGIPVPSPLSPSSATAPWASLSLQSPPAPSAVLPLAPLCVLPHGTMHDSLQSTLHDAHLSTISPSSPLGGLTKCTSCRTSSHAARRCHIPRTSPCRGWLFLMWGNWWGMRMCHPLAIYSDCMFRKGPTGWRRWCPSPLSAVITVTMVASLHTQGFQWMARRAPVPLAYIYTHTDVSYRRHKDGRHQRRHPLGLACGDNVGVTLIYVCILLHPSPLKSS